MNIHELNTKAITNPAYVALDDGSDTYKLDLNAKLSTMQNSISGAESNIATAQGDITLLQTNVVQAQGDIVHAEGEIEDLQRDLNALSTQTSASIGNLQTAQAATEADVTDLKSGLEQTNDNLEELEQKGYPMVSITEAVEAWGNEHQYEIVNNYVSPEMYGAKGDGTTDDSEAFTLMINSGKAVFYLANKTYYINTDLSVDVSNIRIIGAGKKATVVKIGTGKKISFDAPDIDVCGVGFEQGNGVETNSYKINFYDCSFSKSTVGITLNNGFINHIIGCSVMANNIGVVLNDQSYETIIQNCIIDQNKGIGIYILGTATGAIIKNNTIEGNQNANGDGYGIVTNCNYVSLVIDSNWFEYNGKATSIISADIFTFGLYHASDVNDVYTLVTSLVPSYVGHYNNKGKITISNNSFVRTKYGVICTGEGTQYIIFGNSFRGILGLNNQAVTISSRYYQSNTYNIFENTTFNPNDTNIDTEMNAGINGTYIFTVLTFTYAVFDAVRKAILFNGQYLHNTYDLTYTADDNYLESYSNDTYFKRVGDAIYYGITAKIKALPPANTTLFTLPSNVVSAEAIGNYMSTYQMLFYWYNTSFKFRYTSASGTGGWLRMSGVLLVK